MMKDIVGCTVLVTRRCQGCNKVKKRDRHSPIYPLQLNASKQFPGVRRLEEDLMNHAAGEIKRTGGFRGAKLPTAYNLQNFAWDAKCHFDDLQINTNTECAEIRAEFACLKIGSSRIFSNSDMLHCVHAMTMLRVKNNPILDMIPYDTRLK